VPSEGPVERFGLFGPDHPVDQGHDSAEFLVLFLRLGDLFDLLGGWLDPDLDAVPRWIPLHIDARRVGIRPDAEEPLLKLADVLFILKFVLVGCQIRNRPALPGRLE
jgi:hypothetical protein